MESHIPSIQHPVPKSADLLGISNAYEDYLQSCEYAEKTIYNPNVICLSFFVLSGIDRDLAVLMSAIRQYFPNLIQTLHNLGYSLSYLKPNLEEMDQFYDKSYPEQTTVTFESVTDWIYSERAGLKRRLRERVLTVKYLSRYLISVGIDAYVPDIKVGKDFHRHLQLFFSTGMRLNELLECRIGAVHLCGKDSYIYVIGKGNKEQGFRLPRRR